MKCVDHSIIEQRFFLAKVDCSILYTTKICQYQVFYSAHNNNNKKPTIHFYSFNGISSVYYRIFLYLKDIRIMLFSHELNCIIVLWLRRKKTNSLEDINILKYFVLLIQALCVQNGSWVLLEYCRKHTILILCPVIIHLNRRDFTKGNKRPFWPK